MLEKTFGLFYFLKRPKSKKSLDRYVYLRITVNGESRELSLKRRWPESQWNQSSIKAIGNKDGTRELDSYLDTLSAKIQKARLSLLESEKKITAQSLKNLIMSHGNSKMLLEIIAAIIRELKR